VFAISPFLYSVRDVADVIVDTATDFLERFASELNPKPGKGSIELAKMTKGKERDRRGFVDADELDFVELDSRSLKQVNTAGDTNTWECGFFAVFHAGLYLKPASKGLDFTREIYKKYLDSIFRRDDELIARNGITSLRPLRSFYFLDDLYVDTKDLMHTGNITRLASVCMLNKAILDGFYADAAADDITEGASRVIHAMQVKLFEIQPRLVITDKDELSGLRATASLALSEEYERLIARLKGSVDAPPVIIWGTGNHWITVIPDFRTRKLRVFDSYPLMIPSVREALCVLKGIIFP
ncbi:MAG: hypothetical protein EBZ47_09105, partial [Chlamydiae bacterium]|nr:hypothetical protein [Chlamydiota bacterium]